MALVKIRIMNFCVATLRSLAHIWGRFGEIWGIQNHLKLHEIEKRITTI